MGLNKLSNVTENYNELTLIKKKQKHIYRKT